MRTVVVTLAAALLLAACSSSSSPACPGLAGTYAYRQDAPTPCALVAPVSTVKIEIAGHTVVIDDGVEPITCVILPAGGDTIDGCAIYMSGCDGLDPDGSRGSRSPYKWTIDGAGNITGTHYLSASTCKDEGKIADTLTRKK